MSNVTRWKVTSLVLAAFLVGFLVSSAVAGGGSTTKVAGGANTKVALARGSAAFSTTSDTWTNLTGASVTIRVPQGQRAILLATFSGESICNGGVVGDECDVRILFNGNQGQPGPAAPNSGAAFDSEGSGDDYREMHAMQRSRGPVVGGIYTVRVQVETCCGTTFTLDDWHLTVQSFRVG
jgi:hypothetical protein